MGAPVVWFDITSNDPARLTAFFAELFGWTGSDGPSPGYTMIDTGSDAEPEAVSGGIGAPSAPDAPTGITMYVRVDDLQTYLDKAEKLGGSVVAPPMDLDGGYGRIAVIADPDGNPVGLWA
jgi:predicted enzyme related to lactoylglutathione lyase